LNKNLNQKTKDSVIWDLSGAFIRQFALLFISILLARLLEPEEFGILGMSMVFISISQVFTDVGFTSGLIQQKDTKDIAYSSVFYINLLISVVLSGVILLTAPLIANFYEILKVEIILYYLAIIPPIAALGRVQAAILTKQINFKSLTIRDITATLVGGVLGVSAAFLDYGVYSLVIQQIAMVTTGTLMLWFSTNWIPKLEFSTNEIKKLFAFSSFVFLDSVLRQVFNKIDTIFIGKMFSPAMLGFYSRAESLKSQVQTYTTNSLRKVIFPVLSQLQDDDEKFKSTYFKAFNIVTGLIVLLIAPIYFLSNFIIIFLLGAKWEPSIIFFQILIFSGITSPQIGMMGKAVLAKGYSKLKFSIGLIQRLLKTTPIVFGLLFGIKEFAIAVVAASTLVFFVYSIVLDKRLKLSFWLQVKNLLIPNLLFFCFLIFSVLFEKNVNQWLITILFLITHVIYIKLIKHESYTFIQAALKKGISILKKKFSK
jgi:O-antigen/teichoic acid export membrane protein